MIKKCAADQTVVPQRRCPCPVSIRHTRCACLCTCVGVVATVGQGRLSGVRPPPSGSLSRSLQSLTFSWTQALLLGLCALNKCKIVSNFDQQRSSAYPRRVLAPFRAAVVEDPCAFPLPLLRGLGCRVRIGSLPPTQINFSYTSTG